MDYNEFLAFEALNLRLDNFAAALNNHRGTLMVTLDQLRADIQAAKDAIVTEKAEVAAKLTALAATIQALKDQIAAGTGVTQADLDALDASVKEITAGVSDITVPDPVVEPTPPTP